MDADSAEILREQLAALSSQRKALDGDHEQLLQRQASWESVRDRLQSLEQWSRRVAVNLGTLTYQERRMAL